MKYTEVLTKEMFENIAAFSFSEPGAMGANGTMTFYKETGESFTINYLSEETPYSEIKELFPALKECYWNGPMRTDPAALRTIVIGGSPDDKETSIPKGWRHIYLDFGNHLTVKQEMYSFMKDLFKEKDNCEVTFGWADMLDEADFSARIPELMAVFNEQQKFDEHLASVLEELKKNPEYINKVKEASGDMDKMMDVLEEFSGIRMSWFELKQFGFRQAGLD